MKTIKNVSGKRWLPSGVDKFAPIAGRWAGLGRNGKLYPVDHKAELDPEGSTDGTRPDAISAFVFVEKSAGAYELTPRGLVIDTTGDKVTIPASGFVEPLNEIHAGAAFKVVDDDDDNLGKLTIATSGSYNAIAEVVNTAKGFVVVRIGYDTLPAPAATRRSRSTSK